MVSFSCVSATVGEIALVGPSLLESIFPDDFFFLIAVNDACLVDIMGDVR